MYARGDLVLYSEGYYISFMVYLLLFKDSKNIWFARNLGYLGNSWGDNKYGMVRALDKNFKLKLRVEELTESQYKNYMEFKNKYFNNDLI